jgi:hypothetical protein
MRLPCLAALTIGLLLTGCASEAPRVRPIQFSSSTPARLGVSTVDGRSEAMHSGARIAYWLWRDADGLWHLRSTTTKGSHRFQGRIHADTPNTLIIASRVSMESNGRHADDIGLVDGDIAFNLITEGKQDGFDFRVARDTCLEFELRIDGDGDPSRIHLGASQTRPAGAHFLLCP